MRFEFIKCQGSGNDFPLIDARALSPGDAVWAAVARALADRGGPVGGDGLLLLTAGRDGAAFGMRMFNPDGSEAETCLNGLRCAARLGFELTGRMAADVSLATSRASASREAEMAPGVVTIRTRAGPAMPGTRAVGLTIADARLIDGRVAALPSARRFTAVAMPNPHLVSFVDGVDEGELVALGDWCEAGPDLIPARANVSFVEMRGEDAMFVRTYERGVGLTDSCGSAMAAASVAACLTGRVRFGEMLRVYNRGGVVRTSVDAERMVTIAGNASFLYDASVTVDIDTARAHDVVRHHRREDEAAAWDAVVAAIG